MPVMTHLVARTRRRSMRQLALAVWLMTLAVIPGQASAQMRDVPPSIPEVQHAPRLEDFLGDEPVARALRIDGFVQRQPGDGTPASEETVAYLSHDRRALYVVFVCRDREPQAVRARLARREDIAADDLVGVFLDTFHDRRRAYVFLANPRGVQRDALLTEGQGEDGSFDTLWESRGQLTPTGYVVWMAIPFRSLRFSGGGEQSWGVGLMRSIPRTTEEVFWPFISRRVDGVVPQLAALQISRTPTPGRNLQLIPYGAFTDAAFLDPLRTRQYARDARAGVDGKVVWHDRVALDVTVNPDFSHVETDDPQVTINQRYEVYFPEKRPFFLENAGTFQTPETLFFSRRLVSPRWGARLTGKIGRWNVGALAADDRVPADGPAESEARVGIVRLQREIGRESTIGALATTRDGADTRNHVASADARIRLSPRWTLNGQAARTYDEGDRAQTTQGTAVVAEVTRAGRHLTLVNRYLARSPGFLPQLGFVPRTDIREAFQLTSYRWRPVSGRLLAFGPGLAASATWDYDGRPLDRTVNPHFGIELRGATQVLIAGFDNRETFAGRDFRIRAGQLHVSSSRLKWMEVAGFVQAGTRINYAPPPGVPPFLGDTADAFTRVTVRPAAAIAFEQTYVFTSLRATASSAGAPRTGPVFSNHLFRSRLSLQVSRALSVRTILDYVTIRSDAGLTTIGELRRVSPDILVTYQLNPWTAMYGGYMTSSEHLGAEGGDVTDLRRPAGWQTTGRQVFVKASYVVRF
jgi:hypothetical protein